MLSLRASFSNFALWRNSESWNLPAQLSAGYGIRLAAIESVDDVVASQPASGKKEVIFIAGAVATLLTHPGPAGRRRERVPASPPVCRRGPPSVVDLRGKSGNGARSCDRKIATNLRSTTTAAAASVSSDGRRTRSATGRRRLRQAVRHSVDRGRTSTGVSRESRCAARVDPVIEKF